MGVNSDMRKIFYILSVSIFFNIAYSECQGDVNDDYNIDILDVISIMNHILGNEEFPEDLIFNLKPNFLCYFADEINFSAILYRKWSQSFFFDGQTTPPDQES